MAATPDVEIVICRHATTGTQASGYDPLIALILTRASFRPEDFFTQRYYRLAYDQTAAEENTQASNAARMLRACHYTVHLAPGLDEDLNTYQRVVGHAVWQCPVHPDHPNS
ncbi:hypothetical protein ABIA33_007369 [Streptacidiphilus sp. MAP12-16]|uniref:hypothetical protein n=1 Tax=Streptacidiphilus sp. MAP12-16 TaxID=3156300 RepID=UPI0035123A9C